MLLCGHEHPYCEQWCTTHLGGKFRLRLPTPVDVVVTHEAVECVLLQTEHLAEGRGTVAVGVLHHEKWKQQKEVQNLVGGKLAVVSFLYSYVLLLCSLRLLITSEMRFIALWASLCRKNSGTSEKIVVSLCMAKEAVSYVVLIVKIHIFSELN